MTHDHTNTKAYGCVLQHIDVRCASLWANVTAKLKSSSLGLTRIMYKQFFAVKLRDIITFALCAQNKFDIRGKQEFPILLNKFCLNLVL